MFWWNGCRWGNNLWRCNCPCCRGDRWCQRDRWCARRHCCGRWWW